MILTHVTYPAGGHSDEILPATSVPLVSQQTHKQTGQLVILIGSRVRFMSIAFISLLQYALWWYLLIHVVAY